MALVALVVGWYRVPRQVAPAARVERFLSISMDLFSQRVIKQAELSLSLLEVAVVQVVVQVV